MPGDTNNKTAQTEPAEIERIVRANAIRSASPVPTMASACSNSVMSQTAITDMRVALFTARASGT